MADAKIKITAEDGTSEATRRAIANFKSMGDQASKVQGMMGSLGVSIAAAFSAGSVMHVVDMLDRLDDMAEKTGISVQSLSALRYAGESVGTTQEQMAGGLRKLAKLMAESAGGNEQATATFKALGIEVTDTDGKLRKTEHVLSDLAQRFSGWEDGPGKSANAMRLFGKSGEDMIPLLNLGAQGLQTMSNEAKALGVVFGADVAKNAADLNDNLKKIKLASEGAAVALSGPLVKGLADASTAFIEAKKSGEGYLGMLARTSLLIPKIPDWAANLPMFRMAAVLQQGGEALKAAKTTAEIQTYVNKLGANNAGGRGLVNPKGVAPIIAEDDTKKTKTAKAPNHHADNFINQLITEYSNLSGQMSKVEEVTRKLDTASEKFSTTERARALELAGQIDQQKLKATLLDHEIKGLQEQDTALQASETAYQANILAMLDGAQVQQFEVSLLGKNAAAVEKLRFERELSKEVAKAESQVLDEQTQGLITQAEALERLAAIKRFSGERRASFDTLQGDKLDQQNNAGRGVNEGIKTYLESVEKSGDSAKNAVVSAFGGMEDALVNYVKTGKRDFSSLADSIISDMIRMTVQKSITGPLANMASTALTGFLSYDGGGYTGAGSRSGGIDGKGGFLATLHPQETVVDHTKGGQGGGSTINQYSFIVGDVASASMVRQAVAGSERRIAAGMGRSMNYGGALA